MKYKNITVLILILVGLTSLYGVSENAGTTGFSFLKITYSAHAAAKANAFTGQADRIETLFFNPAGVAAIEGNSVSTSYISYVNGFQGGSAAYAFPYNEAVNLGVYSQFLGINNIERTEVDEFNNYVPGTGTFGANNILFGIAGGMEVHELLSVGVGLKMIRESLDDHSALAVAVDLGLLHQTNNENLKVGASLRNFGKQLTYYTDDKYEEKLPLMGVVGFSYSPQDKFTANLDINKPFDQSFNVSAGLEYVVHSMLALRAGYNTRGQNWKLGGDYEYLSGLSTGFGLNWKQYTLDYAITSYGDLGLINQVSFKFDF